MDVIEPASPKPVTEESALTGEGRSVDVGSQQLTGYFELHSPNQEETNMISDLSQMLGFNIDDPTEMLWKVRNIENRIGAPKIGTSRLQHLYNFVKLDSHIKGLEAQRDAYGA